MVPIALSALVLTSLATPQPIGATDEVPFELWLERCGEYESIDYRIRLLDVDGETLDCHFAYESPQRAAVWVGAEGEPIYQFWMDGWDWCGQITEEEVHFEVGLAPAEREIHGWVESVVEDLDLDNLVASPITPYAQFAIVPDPEADEMRFDFSRGWSFGDGVPLQLGWLAHLADLEPELECELVDDAWSLTGNEFRIELDAATGFIRRAWTGTGAEERLAVELVELSIDSGVSDDRFVPAARPDGWTDGSEDFAVIQYRTTWLGCRATVFGAVAASLPEDLELDDGRSAAIAAALAGLHLPEMQEWLDQLRDGVLEAVDEWIAGLEEWCEANRGRDDFEQALDASLASARAVYGQGIADQADRYASSAVLPSPNAESEAFDLLIELERSGLAAAVRTAAEGPVLERLESAGNRLR